MCCDARWAVTVAGSIHFGVSTVDHTYGARKRYEQIEQGCLCQGRLGSGRFSACHGEKSCLSKMHDSRRGVRRDADSDIEREARHA